MFRDDDSNSQVAQQCCNWQIICQFARQQNRQKIGYREGSEMEHYTYINQINACICKELQALFAIGYTLWACGSVFDRKFNSEQPENDCEIPPPVNTNN